MFHCRRVVAANAFIQSSYNHMKLRALVLNSYFCLIESAGKGVCGFANQLVKYRIMY